MKDEIKEILETIKKCIETKDDNIESFLIDIEKWKELLDYITNLQEIEKDHQRINGELRQQLKQTEELAVEYKTRNDKAIEYIECGKTFDDIETARIIDKYEKILLGILKGSDKE